MSTEEYQHIVANIIKYAIYGGLGALALGILIVVLRSIRANLRSRGILGLITIIIQLLTVAGIVILFLHLSKEQDWVNKIEALLP